MMSLVSAHLLSIAPPAPYPRAMDPVVETPDEDAALARRIIDAAPHGDTEAEARLCRRFAPRIRLFGLKRLRSDAAAADLVQDVLMLVLLRLRDGGVREPERIGSFVLGTARQMIIDSNRNSGRRARLLETFSIEFEPVEAPVSSAPDADRLQHCLQALPERERSVLVMTFYDDCPAEQLGTQMGLTTGNVRVIRHRGLKHLRDCLEGTGESR
jgi:RNA polymerase sigma-70 factor (ECF subfamily)